MLNNALKDRAASSVLCWLATVDEHGQPNVSPKEIWAVWDDQHVVIGHIASPTSVRNIAQRAKVCVSFVDVFVQKGFKVQGEARLVPKGHAEYSTWAAPLLPMAGERFTLHAVVVVRATAVEPIVAPSYRLYPQETTETTQVAAAMKTYGVMRSGTTGST
ncbi:MAG: pyridoxamine 5'-phosphate oxidase family protein [Ideonella sp.]|nr:pyridoxamine 5'-phosphate oxidase family protein [Ideonella sp.]